MVRDDQMKVNRKCVQRLWREEGLTIRPKKRRRRKGTRAPGYLAPGRPNQVWAMDFLFDDLTRGRKIKVLNVTDEFTREALAGKVGRRLTAKDTATVLEAIVAIRGAPEAIRCDNGPEFIAKALAAWCKRHGSRTTHIEPGAPWQNAYVESYNGKMRRELLDLELLDSPLEAQVLIDDWRQDYNSYRPHMSLGYTGWSPELPRARVVRAWSGV